MPHILIVEDDRAINDLIAMNLRLVGYTCSQAFDAAQALTMLEQTHADLVLLDVMLPGMDGFALLREKKLRDLPVIYVSAKNNLADRVQGLRLGADDYIVKPFDAVELLARVEAVLRRTQSTRQSFTLLDTVVDLDKRSVTVRGKPVTLTKQEYDLLEVLILNRNIALSRDKLLNAAWSYDYLGDSRTVDVHITKLRKKLGWERAIQTIYKYGYRLEC